MASVLRHDRKSGTRYRVQWYSHNGRKRHIVWLGPKASRKSANKIAEHIDHILQAQRLGLPLERDTELWLRRLPDDLAGRFAKGGLIELRHKTTLAAFLDAFIEGEADKSPNTIIKYRRVQKQLVAYFGAERPLHAITPGDADQWQQALYGGKLSPRGKCSDASVSIGTATAKKFFNVAARRGVVTSNPFAHLKRPDDSSDRKEEVKLAIIDQVIDAAPDADWRLIIALSRYAGLRIPSEIADLRWSDVDWERNGIFFRTPKTAKSGTKVKFIPIFPELRPYLEDARELAAPDERFMVRRHGLSSQALRSQFEKIIKRAGVQQWNVLWNSLRSTRSTDLVEEFPDHVVAKWMGNSPRTLRKNYLQVKDAHWAKATGRSNTIAKPVARATGSAVKSGKARQKLEAADETSEISGICGGLPDSSLDQYPRQGYSNVSNPAENRGESPPARATGSAATSGKTQQTSEIDQDVIDLKVTMRPDQYERLAEAAARLGISIEEHCKRRLLEPPQAASGDAGAEAETTAALVVAGV